MLARSSCLLLCVLLAVPLPSYGQGPRGYVRRIKVPPPGRGQFIFDSANLLDESAEKSLYKIAEDLQREMSTPLFVVTIDSMAAQGGDGMRIERFSKELLEQWQVESRQGAGVNWHNAILLLVAKQDRRARIQFAVPRGRKQDAVAQEIMDTYIVRRFKQEQYSEGIMAGVVGLDLLARNQPLPAAPWPMWVIVVLCGAGTVFVLFAISLYRSGLESWAWRCMKGVIDAMSEGVDEVYDRLRDGVSGGGRSGRGGGDFSGGGGYSGGGFSGGGGFSSGGGCSGGGGASGSW